MVNIWPCINLNPDRDTFIEYDQCLGYARDQSAAEVGGVFVVWYF